MIFWATVLAFVLGIMYYMIYPYDTKIQTLYMPSSEAYVAGFVAQHQAAKDYAREAVIAINHLTTTLPKQNNTTPSVLILSDADPDKSVIEPFLMPKIASVQTSNFHPNLTGYTPPVGKQSLDYGEGFVSILSCFDKPERKLKDSKEYDNATLTDCRAATTKYAMTYGPVPDELSKPYMRGKALLWEPALLKRTKGNPDCGFLYYDTVSQHYYINNSRHLTRLVPNSFVNLLQNGGYLSKDTAGRVLVGSGETARDLLFCMTPINDPYPRLGLKVLLDGTINALPPGNHNDTIPTTGKWLDLVDEKTLGIETTSAGQSAWNISCTAKTADCYKDGFEFAKNRSVVVVPSDKFTTNQQLFKTPFTISFMGFFKLGSYPVFATQDQKGSSSCTSTSINACVTATYANGKLTITVKSGSFSTSSTLQASVPANTYKQIDYIFNAGGQRVYVDGKLAEEKKFTSDISALAGNAFILGGSTTDFILYNFLVYNRSPEESSISPDKFDLYGLPRVLKSNTLRYINKTGKIKPQDRTEQLKGRKK